MREAVVRDGRLILFEERTVMYEPPADELARAEAVCPGWNVVPGDVDGAVVFVPRPALRAPVQRALVGA